MTIRKQWLIILILIAVFSVTVNTLVLGSLIDRYFTGYMHENYETHLSELVNYAQKALTEKDLSIRQMAIELETHLDDPITRIKLYNIRGQLVVDVVNENNIPNMMRNKGMFNRMMGMQLEEVDHTPIYDGKRLVGQLNVTRYSAVENSMATRMFKAALLSNSLLSIAIVLIFAVMIGIIVSKRISKDLIQTSLLAQDIELGKASAVKFSKITEIRVIQQSLETLKTKLNLKNKSRKNLLDEMVHQSRTPLTILKNHLEGYEDGIINMDTEEIKICGEQIENLTSIIANLSSMIDAEKDEEQIKVEGFEFNQLLQQIVGGLKGQFNKRSIELSLLNQEKVQLNTDRYKLSQAIYNVLTNAYKYTLENGKVTIAYTANSEQLTIAITDNGIGIADNEQKKIFNAYYRGSSVNNIAGEGIGLFVANENLQKIHGTISVESQLGTGSKFIISLPVDLRNHKE